MLAYLLALTVSLAAEPSAAEARGLLPEDFYKEVTIEDTALSPDGSLLAFTVMTIDEEHNKRKRAIWMQVLKNGEPQGEPYRFTSPTENTTSPVWSPDGQVLSFQSKRGEDENTTWFIRATAPGGEAYHIEGVEGAPVWSRDGSWIAYVKEPKDEDLNDKTDEDEKDKESTAEPPKKKEEEREGWISPDAITGTLNAKRFDGHVYTTMRMKRDGTRTLLPHVSARNKRQLYVVPAGGGEAVKVTDTAFDLSDPVWLADNGTLLFTGDAFEDDEYNDDYTRDIYAVAREGGEVHKLTSGLGSEYGLAVSPDGERLAYVFSAGPGEPSDVYVVTIGEDGTLEGDAENLTADWDLSPGAPDWAGNSRTVRWLAGIGGNRHVFESNLRGDIHQVTQGDRTLSSVAHARDARVMAYTSTDPLHPTELYVARRDGSKETRLTEFNDAWLDDVALVPPERITYTVSDGTPIEGWVMKPVGYTPGAKQYPMILEIHGGPHGAYGNYWFRAFHILSNAGFFVVYTNPRGSSAYGHDFMYATLGKWGEMDSEDYLAGVETAVNTYPDVDAERVGVAGGSYGGFMSAWLSATTDRFAVANPSRMIANWESWFGGSDAQRLTEYEFDGEPWEVRDVYRRLSPLTYVENVFAPTLIIQSENDYRTPMPDAEQWYMALKKRGVPVELVRYPRSSHGLSRTGEPWLLVDRLNRITTWFTHWLVEENLTNAEAKRRYGQPVLLTRDDLRNATYRLPDNLVEDAEDATIALVDGRYDNPEAHLQAGLTEYMASAPLDSTPGTDAVAVMYANTGGTGVFEYLVLVSNVDGKPFHTASLYLGDRIQVHGLSAEDGTITVDLTVHGPDDPMCCPTRRITRTYTVDAGRLVQQDEGADD